MRGITRVLVVLPLLACHATQPHVTPPRPATRVREARPSIDRREGLGVVPGRVQATLSPELWNATFTLAGASGIERLRAGSALMTLLRCHDVRRVWRAMPQLEQRSGDRVVVLPYRDWQARAIAARPKRPNQREYQPPALTGVENEFEFEFPRESDLELIVARLNDIAGVRHARAVTIPAPAFNPNDPGWLDPSDPKFSSQLEKGRWGFHNLKLGSGFLDDFDVDAPEAWDIERGDPMLVVAVFDTQLDVTHPDLYRNIFLNNGEVPPSVVTKFKSAAELTFDDLNATGVPAQLAQMNAGWTDTNGNGYIDGEDAVAWWSDGTDGDGNGFTDDLVGWNFLAGTNKSFGGPANCGPYGGHGTCVAGLIAATANNGSGIAGIAHRVRILPVTSSFSLGETEYAKSFPQVRVINHSMGDAFPDPAASIALLETLEPEGVLYVAALGNDDQFTYGVDPARRETVMAVTNFQSDGVRTGTSSYGPKTDVAAPGAGMWSLKPFSGGATVAFSGTSASSPVVAGVAALIASQKPTLTPEQIRQSLRATAHDPIAIPNDNGENTPGFDVYSGWGLVNAKSGLDDVVAGTKRPRANIVSLQKNYEAPRRNDEMAIAIGKVSIRAFAGIPGSAATWKVWRATKADLSDKVLAGSGNIASATSEPATLMEIDTDPLDGRQYIELEVTAGGVTSRDRAVIDLPRAHIFNVADGEVVVGLPALLGFAYGPGFQKYRIQVAPGWTPAEASFVDVAVSTTVQAPQIKDRTQPTQLHGPIDTSTLGIAVPPTGEATLRLRTEAGSRVWTDAVKIRVNGKQPPMRAGFPVNMESESQPSPTAVDLDGDGIKEIVTGTSSTGGRIRIVHADGTNSVTTIQPGGEYILETPALGDVDGDGRPDIVVRTERGPQTEIIRVLTADLVKIGGAFPIEFENPQISFNAPRPATPVLADVTEDGQLDVLFGMPRNSSIASPRIRAVHGNDGSTIRDYATENDLDFITPPVAGDLDGDGVPEVAAIAAKLGSGGRTTLFCWKLDGTLAWKAVLRNDVGGEPYGPILIDRDGDQKLEIVAGADGVGVGATSDFLRLFDGSGKELGMLPHAETQYLMSAAPLKPSSAPNDLSVVFAAQHVDVQKVFLYAADPKTMTDRAGWPAAQVTERDAFGPPVIADLRGDGDLEVAFANGPMPSANVPTQMVLVQPDGKQVSDNGEWPLLFPAGVQATPLVTDLDGDGHPDLVVQCGEPDGKLYAFALPGNTHPGWNAWGEERHDPRRTANLHGDLRIISPSAVHAEEVGPFNDATLQGALVIRTEFARGAPAGDTDVTKWSVRIGALDTTVREVSRVQGEHWLLVDPIAQPAAGPQTLRVTFNDGGIRTWDAARDAVKYTAGNEQQSTIAVIDHSGSMNDDGKIAAARVAARFYAESAYAKDQVGVVVFNPTATDLLGGLFVAGPNRTKVADAIDGVTAGGKTSIGAGIEKALDLLKTAGTVSNRWGLVLLTDGLENTAPLWSEASAAAKNVKSSHAAGFEIDTVALGPDADQQLLSSIASTTGGSFTPVALGHSLSMLNRLADAFHYARERVDGTQRLMTRGDTLPAHDHWNDSVVVPFGARRLQFALNADRPLPRRLTLDVRGPNGAPAQGSMTRSTNSIVVTVDAPAPGTWKTRIANRSNGEIELLLLAAAAVPTRAHVVWKPPFLIAYATNNRGFVRNVTATITRPDKTTFDVPLRDAGNGIFSAKLPLDAVDAHRVTLRAGGITHVSHLFGDWDRDRDGIPDAWERRHNDCGTDLNPRGDPDGDGLTNAEEAHLGTDPHVANPRP